MAETKGKPTSKTSKTPAVKKAPAKTAATKKSSPKKTVTPAKNRMSGEERYRMVEVAAYFLAERNNFAGNPVEYWSAAEHQISKLLGE
jgi:hypothetical protein